MDGKTPKEKLLDACGAQNPGAAASRPTQDRDSNKYYQALLDRAENASASARQAQDQTDQCYRRLNDYVRRELPPQLVQAFQEVSQQEIARALRPLHDSTSQAAGRIDSCAEDLARMSWNWRLMVLAVLVGIATVSLGTALVRWTLLDSRFEEAKRYEIWGRDVADRMKNSSPKERERIFRWVRGGEL